MTKVERRVRLDQLLVERGLAASRARAQALIMAGTVFSQDKALTKPGILLRPDVPLILKGRDHPWVSRGGVKLSHALDHFGIVPAGWVCADIGSSTGGFTDVLISRDAARVYDVDVGYGLLAWKLRRDQRVIPLENLNCRELTRAHIEEPIDLVVCDVAFIGLEMALPAPMALVRDGGFLVALIKPQFEVGRTKVGRGGIVRNAKDREEACNRIAAWLAGRPGWRVLGLCESPITGADGNVEVFIAACRDAPPASSALPDRVPDGNPPSEGA